MKAYIAAILIAGVIAGTGIGMAASAILWRGNVGSFHGRITVEAPGATVEGFGTETLDPVEWTNTEIQITTTSFTVSVSGKDPVILTLWVNTTTSQGLEALQTWDLAFRYQSGGYPEELQSISYSNPTQNVSFMLEPGNYTIYVDFQYTPNPNLQSTTDFNLDVEGLVTGT
ncbi:MAG: hypothetical protein J7L55_03380 [Desulfurococcales archaeon]|nr:hypothetical protein [Desulfurococcales archaeon]